MAGTQPVIIGGIALDALTVYVRDYEATAPDYPVEKGFNIQDHIILSPMFIDITGIITNTPLSGGGSKGRVERIAKELERLYESKELITVTTTKGIYRNMAVVTLSLPYKRETGTSMEVTVRLKQIRETSAETTTIPDSYGKSGETGVNAGTANQQSGSQSGMSTAAGKEESVNNQSILYGLAGNLLGGSG